MKKHPTPGTHTLARRLRHDVTEAEKRLWQILRSQQMNGYKFRRQVPIGRYIADFVCHAARLIVEVDGGQHDPSAPQEIERTAFLQSQGYRVLRFWNKEVLENLDGVHRRIVDHLSDLDPTRSDPNTPSPSMGEGRGGGELSASRPVPMHHPHPNPPPSRGRASGAQR